MIYLNFFLRLPRKSRPDIKEIYYWDKKITKNKALSIQFDRHKGRISIGCGLSLDFFQDHAGLVLDLEVPGYDLVVNLYDIRHWDYETKTWEKYDSTDQSSNER